MSLLNGSYIVALKASGLQDGRLVALMVERSKIKRET
jgi:hypothetical protein